MDLANQLIGHFDFEDLDSSALHNCSNVSWSLRADNLDCALISTALVSPWFGFSRFIQATLIAQGEARERIKFPTL